MNEKITLIDIKYRNMLKLQAASRSYEVILEQCNSIKIVVESLKQIVLLFTEEDGIYNALHSFVTETDLIVGNFEEESMAVRTKTAAQQAEEAGLLNEEFLNSGEIACLCRKVEDLRNDVYEISRSLAWITGSVKAAFSSGSTADVEEIKAMLDELNRTALKIGDTLVGNYEDN